MEVCQGCDGFRVPARRRWPGDSPRCSWWRTLPTGLTVQQLADQVGVHRTIAYRLLVDIGPVPVGGQGRRRPLPARRRPGRARCVVRPQRAPAESADAARAGRRSGHHGVVARRRGRPAGGDRGDRADPCRLPTVLSRGQPVSAGPRRRRYRACWPACPRAPDERDLVVTGPRAWLGDRPTERSNRIPTAWRWRSTAQRRHRRPASTSSPTAKTS